MHSCRRFRAWSTTSVYISTMYASTAGTARLTCARAPGISCAKRLASAPGNRGSVRAPCTGEAAEGAPQTSTSPAAEEEEVVQFEGNGSKAELAIALLLGATLIYLPLTLASLGRFLWIEYKVTNQRVIVSVDSPIRKDMTQIAYSQIKEVRAVNRFFGLWGDMVLFLKDGSRLELAGIEDVMAIKLYIEGQAF